MNNYKELSFLISSLFVIYFFKDIITTLIILVILSSISLILIKADFEKKINNYNNDNNKTQNPSNVKLEPIPTYSSNVKKEQYNNTPPSPNNEVKSSNFVYNR